MKREVKIVLVHEMDVMKGWCDFGAFFAECPNELIEPPISLFNEIAIPLYAKNEYRIVSLSTILLKMGATKSSGRKASQLVLRKMLRCCTE